MGSVSILPFLILIVVVLGVFIVVKNLKTDRPKLLSAVCIIAAMLFLWSASLEIAGYDQVPGNNKGYITFLMIASIVSLVGVYGLWQMKKWGAYIFFLTHAIWILSSIILFGLPFGRPNPSSSQASDGIGFVIFLLLFFDITVLYYFKRLT